MRSGLHILAAFICFFLYFLISRGFVNIIITHIFNRSHYKKLKKGQNFWDWLLFRRFKDVVPKSYLWYYYSSGILFVVTVLVILILDFSHVDERYFIICWNIYLAWFALTWLYIHFCFYDRKRNEYDPGRVVERRGMNKKKK